VSDATYRIIEVTGTSAVGVTEAMQNGVARANRTLRNLDWIEVNNIRGHIADGQIAHFQVSMKVGFRMDDPD
jgi:dodecin